MHFSTEGVFDGVFQNTFSGVFPLMCICLSFLLLALFCSVQVLYSLASGSDSSFCVYSCVWNSAMHQCYLKTHSYTHFLSLFLTDKQTIKYRHTQQAQAQSFQDLHTIMLVSLCVNVRTRPVTSFHFIGKT